MDELAKLAGVTLGTAYQYHAYKMYDFPKHHGKVGQILFWKRSTAEAWARKHKKRSR
ncbi:hypothetical protein KMZ68_02105 [Bradyrhizobium sediminis]|uniref:Uncharacterized protein n=1 Tax=Bradyrhizobium sediminis TaxID=2840469 RepID=A0A975NQF3_9BRAD|nr:hypothetical protein [Bradyrhizobium sediminis]QWG18714.1 hypothetical protein KMZ68_02105 [Bradyrhizobium sediminis]